MSEGKEGSTPREIGFGSVVLITRNKDEPPERYVVIDPFSTFEGIEVAKVVEKDEDGEKTQTLSGSASFQTSDIEKILEEKWDIERIIEGSKKFLGINDLSEATKLRYKEASEKPNREI